MSVLKYNYNELFCFCNELMGDELYYNTEMVIILDARNIFKLNRKILLYYEYLKSQGECKDV